MPTTSMSLKFWMRRAQHVAADTAEAVDANLDRHASLAAVALPAAAQSAGDWTIGIGVHQVDPKSDNGVLANGTLPLSINSDAKPSLTFEYFSARNLGVEVLAAWPFQHDISVKGVGRVGSTKHLPPTVSLQYHFNDKGVVPRCSASA
jgi:outer membrane protein